MTTDPKRQVVINVTVDRAQVDRAIEDLRAELAARQNRTMRVLGVKLLPPLDADGEAVELEASGWRRPLLRVGLVSIIVGLLIGFGAGVATSASAAPRVERAEWRVSTYGWPGDDPYQRLAGCGYTKIGGLDAGQPMPCHLTPTLPIVAHRTLPLGTLVRICYTRRATPDGVLVRRCAGARIGDRCGPGCDANHVDADLSWGLARRIGFPYSIGRVTVLRVVEP